MKKLFLAGAALIALTGTQAGAADLPRKPVYKAPPPVAAPVPFSWTGFYVGLNAGGAWARENPTLNLINFGPADTAAFRAAGSQGSHPSSFTGGGQVGYNLQTGPAVLGIEADLNSLRLHASRFVPLVPGTTFPASVATSFETDWIATVRGRIGYAYDRLLVYGTGGLAVANHKFSQTFTQLNFPFSETGSVSATKDGWTAGGGLEYALGKGWSVKGEYLYADLGQVSVISIGNCPTISGGCPTNMASHSDKLRIQIARAGINYRFDWGKGKGKAPVVAKY